MYVKESCVFLILGLIGSVEGGVCGKGKGWGVNG